ncbi:SusC/RagA family TonB-linked outer membrane protein [Pedobacter endophyticus]|uniref:SusC/RagA family TonB-linked outer membrane protein n=1 Tax=Pedobacter endophyticus TaxID=2789740 RepID=A0A7S9L1M4_9SPHI|nr:SusC/RagA family TonB-linked outer membrane protein [Pedobacter endophyticus]QPH40840.1 SusC/RagA family TonB-linked outer membrane protein [Pedobacter endophyticus]
MNKTTTPFNFKIVVACLGLFPALSYAQQTPTKTVDSTLIKRYDQKNYQQKELGAWNSTIKKENQIEGVATIYSDDVNSTPVSDITSTLAGRITGLYTVQSSARTGFDNSVLTLRGQAPLIVIDGVVRSFTSFNPDDVESISVFKDALSASMYGQRSSGGVVYITTKKQAYNNPFEIHFGAEYGHLENLFTPKFLTGGDYARIYNEAQQNTSPGSTPLYSDAVIAAYDNRTNDPFLQPNNNWYDLVYKKNSAQKRYNVGVAGKSENFKYYASLENFNSDGNFVTDSKNNYNTNNFYKRYNIRTNAEIKFNDDISLQLNIFGSIENNNQPGGFATNIMNLIYSTSPLAYAVKNPDGTYGGTASITSNILANTIDAGYIRATTRSINSDVALTYKLDDITPGLWVKGGLSINNYYNEFISKNKTFAIYYPTVNGSDVSYTKSGTDGNVGLGTGSFNLDAQLKQTYYNFMAGYDRSFNDHHLHVLATYNGDNSLLSIGQLNQIFKTAGLALKYNFKEKYFAEMGNAYGSYNRYADAKKWIYLPSIGLGWQVSKEDWFNTNTVNFLKLRSTFGLTANANTADYYSYLQRYSLNTTGYVFGTGLTGVAGAAEMGLATVGVGPEKAQKFEIGADAAFINNKLNVGLTYYNNKYYDLLLAKPYASTIIGKPYPSQNLGKTRFTGFEGTIDFLGRAGELGYKIGLNVSVQKNKLLDAAEPNLPYPWMYAAGQPAGLFGYEAIGFYKSGETAANTATLLGYSPVPGDIKYRDLNADGVISTLDQKRISGDKPLVFGGLNLSFNYKGFDLKALLQGVANREIMIDPTSQLALNNNTGYVLDYTTENRWTPQNQENATLPRLTLGTNVNNNQTSTFWSKNGNYLRLKNVELGYSLPRQLTNKLKIKSLRFFVNSYNLLTISQLDFDPESYLSGFPNQRVINGGVSLTL